MEDTEQGRRVLNAQGRRQARPGESQPITSWSCSRAGRGRTAGGESAPTPGAPAVSGAPLAPGSCARPGLAGTARAIRPAVAATTGRRLLSSRFVTEAALPSPVLLPPWASHWDGPKPGDRPGSGV